MSNINYYNALIAKICKTLKTLRWPNYPGSFRNDLPKGGRFDTRFANLRRLFCRIGTDIRTKWFAARLPIR
ncbi:MAG: hypothetical protein FD143_3769 [Ignavibacteria bacterium]|nr:MAG: hypothetical protein FD143_3769 [Ignavibacteria bacterium]